MRRRRGPVTGLSVANVPSSAELAVSMVDLDNGRVHWLQVAIPADSDGLVQHQLLPGAVELTNDFGEATYDGPCPPAGQRHRYELVLYALPRPFVAPTQGDPTAVLAALVAQAAETATFTAAYTRQ